MDENGVSDVSKMEVVKRMSGPEEEKYTIKQIIDAITQAGDEILYALLHENREILEDVLGDFLCMGGKGSGKGLFRRCTLYRACIKDHPTRAQ